MTSMSRDSSRAASEPTNRSRMTAIATTEEAALKKPWATRSPMRAPMLGANMHRIEVIRCPASPTSTGSRRPNRSERGPMTSWPTAPPMSMPERVSWAAAGLAPNSAPTVGSAGR
jgi:hypothetical protein